MSIPKVSFIVPFYNNGETLPETIKSIRSQDYTYYDIWIIDDDSTDQHSVEVLAGFKDQPGIMVLHQANAGPSVARNLAIMQTDAEIIVPLDSDDLIRPGALSLAIQTLKKHPDVDIVYSDLHLFGDVHKAKKQAPVIDLRQLLLYNPVALCTFIRKRVFEEIGYFDEAMSKKGLEDWEYWIRAFSRGCKFHHIAETLFDIRVRSDSRTFTQANKNLQELKDYVYQKHIRILATEYKGIYYDLRTLQSSRVLRLINFVARPYRAIKQLLRSK